MTEETNEEPQSW